MPSAERVTKLHSLFVDHNTTPATASAQFGIREANTVLCRGEHFGRVCENCFSLLEKRRTGAVPSVSDHVVIESRFGRESDASATRAAAVVLQHDLVCLRVLRRARRGRGALLKTQFFLSSGLACSFLAVLNVRDNTILESADSAGAHHVPERDALPRLLAASLRQVV